jgi:hypothetical protein
MHIEIRSAEVHSQERSSPSTGKPYVIRTQAAFLVGVEERKKFELRLEDGQVSYAPGRYEISSESLTVDQYKRLSLGRVTLEPVAADMKLQAAK